MSQATKRKHVTREVLYDFIVPNDNQKIVKIIGSKGNNLHEVVTPEGEHYLASMPSKFRKNIWIKRGDYVVVEPISEGDRVKAEIVAILYKDHIRYIQQQGQWPKFHDDSRESDDAIEKVIPNDWLPPAIDTDDSDTEFNFVNPNRQEIIESSSSGDENDDEDGSFENNDIR